ncbi:hypothetical protein [Nocardia africana]|uniref:Uncharacterized protein n=1 Tax=Nocardia africana TaxID=134964 RepID=A0A378WUU9_9NOCA|nr:hypothetical protein [Nocardia africana]SUA44998.1 Uncharacterised protein [Nocardia africana]
MNELVVQHLGTASAATLLQIVPTAQVLLESVVLTPQERVNFIADL